MITGFSGTSDSSYLLPTSIAQRDPEDQVGTNAQVLMYLLRPENERYICIHDENHGPLSTSAFLNHLVHEQPEVRVLLDIGAQVGVQTFDLLPLMEGTHQIDTDVGSQE